MNRPTSFHEDVARQPY